MTYVKNARQLLAVAQGFEPKPADAVTLLTDTLAHAVDATGVPVADVIARLRDSVETLAAASQQSRTFRLPSKGPHHRNRTSDEGNFA